MVWLYACYWFLLFLYSVVFAIVFFLLVICFVMVLAIMDRRSEVADRISAINLSAIALVVFVVRLLGFNLFVLVVLDGDVVAVAWIKVDFDAASVGVVFGLGLLDRCAVCDVVVIFVLIGEDVVALLTAVCAFGVVFIGVIGLYVCALLAVIAGVSVGLVLAVVSSSIRCFDCPTAIFSFGAIVVFDL